MFVVQLHFIQTNSLDVNGASIMAKIFLAKLCSFLITEACPAMPA
jgi:hypothetical protein